MSKRKCPDCQGVGEVYEGTKDPPEFVWNDNFIIHWARSIGWVIKCILCGGTGEVEDEGD